MTYFDEATETLPREQLAALQLGKLQAMMANVLPDPVLAKKHRDMAQSESDKLAAE